MLSSESASKSARTKALELAVNHSSSAASPSEIAAKASTFLNFLEGKFAPITGTAEAPYSKVNTKRDLAGLEVQARSMGVEDIKAAAGGLLGMTAKEVQDTAPPPKTHNLTFAEAFQAMVDGKAAKRQGEKDWLTIIERWNPRFAAIPSNNTVIVNPADMMATDWQIIGLNTVEMWGPV